MKIIQTLFLLACLVLGPSPWAQAAQSSTSSGAGASDEQKRLAAFEALAPLSGVQRLKGGIVDITVPKGMTLLAGPWGRAWLMDVQGKKKEEVASVDALLLPLGQPITQSPWYVEISVDEVGHVGLDNPPEDLPKRLQAEMEAALESSFPGGKSAEVLFNKESFSFRIDKSYENAPLVHVRGLVHAAGDDKNTGIVSSQIVVFGKKHAVTLSTNVESIYLADFEALQEKIEHAVSFTETNGYKDFIDGFDRSGPSLESVLLDGKEASLLEMSSSERRAWMRRARNGVALFVGLFGAVYLVLKTRLRRFLGLGGGRIEVKASTWQGEDPPTWVGSKAP